MFPDSFLLSVSFQWSRLSHWTRGLGFLEVSHISKDRGTESIKYLVAMSYVTRSPATFSCELKIFVLPFAADIPAEVLLSLLAFILMSLDSTLHMLWFSKSNTSELLHSSVPPQPLVCFLFMPEFFSLSSCTHQDGQFLGLDEEIPEKTNVSSLLLFSPGLYLP